MFKMCFDVQRIKFHRNESSIQRMLIHLAIIVSLSHGSGCNPCAALVVSAISKRKGIKQAVIGTAGHMLCALNHKLKI